MQLSFNLWMLLAQLSLFESDGHHNLHNLIGIQGKISSSGWVKYPNASAPALNQARFMMKGWASDMIMRPIQKRIGVAAGFNPVSIQGHL